MNTNASTQSVACTLTLPDGRVFTFEMAGPLVAMAPAAGQTEKQHKKTSRRRK